jgi:hypothetical protein
VGGCFEFAEGDAAVVTRAQLDRFNGISACVQVAQLEVALSLLREMPQLRLISMLYLISFMVGISACEKVAQWKVSTSMRSGISAVRCRSDQCCSRSRDSWLALVYARKYPVWSL